MQKLSKGYLGYLLAVNVHIYLSWNFVTETNNQCPKNYQADYVEKNWALAMMLKALPLVHFLSILLKEQMITSVRKTIIKNTGLISTKPIDF